MRRVPQKCSLTPSHSEIKSPSASESISPPFYSIYPLMFHLDFPIKDDGDRLLPWLFGLCFLSSQQMCAKSKIRHTTGCLLFQKGCGKRTQVVYKFVEPSVIIASYCYFCVSLGTATVREQGCRKHIYNSRFIISTANRTACKPFSLRSDQFTFKELK